MLVGLGADPNGEHVPDDGYNVGVNALTEAVRLEATDLVKFLVDNGADVNKSALNNIPPVILAIKNIDILRYLVDNGANIHVNVTLHNKNYTISKYFAIRCQSEHNIDIDVLRFLLDNGIDVNANLLDNVGAHGYTFLSMFCTFPDLIMSENIISVIILLLDKGADTNIIIGNTGKNVKEILRIRITERNRAQFQGMDDYNEDMVDTAIEYMINRYRVILATIETHSNSR